MGFNLDSLFIEWRAKVSDGVPNINNDYHLVILKEICLNKGIDKDIVDNVILVLEKDEKIDPETIVKYKDEDGEEKETQYSYANKQPEGTPAKTAADRLKGGEKEKEDTPDKVPAKDFESDPKKGGDGYMSKDDGDGRKSKEKPKTKGEPDSGEEEAKPKTKEELEQIDNQIVDDTLVYTETQAKKDQDKAGGRKGVGLGTDVSRAGEAAVHKGIRMMMKGDSIEEVYSLLRGVAEEKDTFLTNEWVDAAVSSIKAIKNEVGIEKIETVAWDTDEGRESIGVNTKLETSSDMFVRTKDGKNIGVSLKDSGDVFLANGGWKEQSDNLLDELKSDMPEVEHGQLKEAMGIDTFKENRSSSFRNVLNQLGTDGLEQMIKNIQDDSSKPIGDYIDKLSDVPSLINKIESENLSGDEMKAIAKMLKVSDKELEQTLRGPEKQLVRDTFDILNSSVEAKRGMNKWILKNMHVFDSLGLNKNLKSGGVDEFITVFGTKPDGSTMKEDSIKDLFGSQVSDMLIENLKEIKNGNMESEELEDYMADRMELDHDTGRINFRHENNLKYPLFYLAGRTRGIGTAPVLEIHSTPMFERSLEAGTFNTDEWSPEQLKRLKGDFKKAAQRADDKLKAK